MAQTSAARYVALQDPRENTTMYGRDPRQPLPFQEMYQRMFATKVSAIKFAALYSVFKLHTGGDVQFRLFKQKVSKILQQR
jgi:hypothetical protein